MIHSKAHFNYKKTTLLLWSFGMSIMVLAQNNSLIINGNAYLKLNGGAQPNPVYLVVNQPSTNGITTSGGWVISEGNYNYIKWNAGTGTGNYVYPFGYNTANYIPFTFNKTTAGSSNISVSTWSTNQQNMPHAGISDNGTVPACTNMGGVWGGDSVTAVIDRWWDIYATSPVTAHLTFSYRGAENTTATPTGLFQAQHWNGTAWDAPVPVGNIGVTSGVGTVNASSVSDFSPYVLVTAITPLPIELLSFTGSVVGSYNLLQWQTASEINNDYFTVEHTRDGNTWQFLGTVDGAGNSNSLLNYSLIDPYPLNGITYYRLKQTDFNGDYEYSQVIALNRNAIEDGEIFNAYDSPDGVIVHFKQNEQGNLSVYNAMGQLVASKSVDKGSGYYVLNKDQWSTGIYFIVFESSTIETKKIYITR